MQPSAPVAIASALHRRGLTSQKAQAACLGLSREHWNRYCKGHQSPSAAKLQTWLEACDKAGHTLHLTCDPHIGWVAHEAT